ncbi:hypothetical protein EVA_08970, partial [gut metagenome]
TEQTEAALAAAEQQSTGSYVEDPKAFAAAIKSVLGDAVNEETLVRLLERGQMQGKSQIELGTGTKRISREDKKNSNR